MKIWEKLRVAESTVKLLMVMAIVFITTYSSWLIARYALLTDQPLVYVASGSMYPTLRVGDLLFVRGVKPDEIEVGDVIVFMKPTGAREYIVHRVIDIKKEGDRILITTRGDNNPSSFSWERDFDSSYVVGKVFFWVRFIGFIPMVLQEPWVKWSIATILALLIVYDFTSEILEKRHRRGEDKR